MNDYTTAFDSTRNNQGLSGFDATQPAPAYSPLPAGIYIARVIRGEVTQTKAGHDAYRLIFEVTEGPYAGRTLMRLWTFTPKALPYTKRDLAAFGLTSSQQLLSPFPESGKEYIVRLVVALQRGNDGTEFNDIKRCDVLRVVDAPVAQFIVSQKSEGGSQ
jgi:hypothetical protein